MTKRLLGWLVLLPLCIILVVFSLANRHVVEVQFDPLLSQPPLIPSIQVPLFLVIYSVLIFGIVLGGAATWITQGGQRRQKRRWYNRARQLEEEKTRARQEADKNRGEHQAFFKAN